MSRVCNLSAVFAAAAAILMSTPAWGQSFGGTRTPTSSGLTSGLSFGNATFGSSGGLGTSGFGQSSFGQGSFGQGGLGQTGLGSTGFGNTGFGGQGGQSNSGFVGRDSSEVTSMFQNMARQGQQFMNRVERAVNRNNGNRDTGGTTQQQVRVQLKVGFDYPEPASHPMAAEFNSRLAKLLVDRKVGNVAVERNGSAVTLTGTAANEFERMVVERLVAQQPGVTAVTNQMTVGEPLAAPTLQE